MKATNYGVYNLLSFIVILLSRITCSDSFSTQGSYPKRASVRFTFSSSSVTLPSTTTSQSFTKYHQHKNNNVPQHLFMLRNIDLPEAIIFYGLDTILDLSEEMEKPGSIRLIDECSELQTPVILLSERLKVEELLSSLSPYTKLTKYLHDPKRKNSLKNILHLRSSLEEFVVDNNNEDAEFFLGDDAPYLNQGQKVGHAPCPAAILDAVNSIVIEPRGFGSREFGIKHHETIRNPLPQHCVVFVAKSSDNDADSDSMSRMRCIASRLAGMRVIYIEDEGIGTCTAEDISDGIVEDLDDPVQEINLDSISTPGSFWLNMALPRDESGDRIDPDAYIRTFVSERLKLQEQGAKNSEENTPETKENDVAYVDDGLDEEDIQNILLDLDPL